MDAVEALAQSWASIDGKLERFLACKADPKLDDTEGRYQGYMCEAEEMIRRLRKRGYQVVPACGGGSALEYGLIAGLVTIVAIFAIQWIAQ